MGESKKESRPKPTWRRGIYVPSGLSLYRGPSSGDFAEARSVELSRGPYGPGKCLRTPTDDEWRALGRGGRKD